MRGHAVNKRDHSTCEIRGVDTSGTETWPTLTCNRIQYNFVMVPCMSTHAKIKL